MVKTTIRSAVVDASVLSEGGAMVPTAINSADCQTVRQKGHIKWPLVQVSEGERELGIPPAVVLGMAPGTKFADTHGGRVSLLEYLAEGRELLPFGEFVLGELLRRRDAPPIGAGASSGSVGPTGFFKRLP